MRYRFAVIMATISGIVGGVTAAATPYYIGVIVDHIKSGVVLSQILTDALVLIGITLVSLVAFFGMRAYSGTIAYSVNLDIRETIYANLLTLDHEFFQQHAIGDLISRIQSDTEWIWRLLALGFNRLGSSILTLVVTFALLASVSFPLTLVVFILLAISTTIQMRVGTILGPIYERVQDQAGVVATQVQDATSGIQTIKTFGKEAGAAAQFLKENKEYRRRWLFHKRIHEPVGMVPNTIAQSTQAIVVFFGGMLTLSGQMTLGNFVQFLIFLESITQMLLNISTIYQRYQQTRGALARLTPLLQPTIIADDPAAVALSSPKGDIVFENVGVQLEGIWLLRGLNLTIRAGQVVALIGPTGAGKSLLVSLLARVRDPDEGRILIDGQDIRTLKLSDLRETIAYVPQSTFLFSLPLHKNIRMGKATIADEDVDKATQISRLVNDLPQLPQGLETLVGEKGVMLSGGQKQRVAIARALVRDPAILVLDDALSSVDTQTAADILHDLRDVLRTRTSIIIAHRIATVKDADMIVVLDNGAIIEQGTHTALVQRGGMYARMVERELYQAVTAADPARLAQASD